MAHSCDCYSSTTPCGHDNSVTFIKIYLCVLCVLYAIVPRLLVIDVQLCGMEGSV